MQGAEGTDDVAVATIFVSHAWKYPIVDVLEQLIKLGTAEPGQYFWLDFLMVDQNKAYNDFDIIIFWLQFSPLASASAAVIVPQCVAYIAQLDCAR